MTVVETVEGAEEGDCDGGEVHDEVGDCGRDGEEFGGAHCLPAFGGEGDGDFVLGGGC